MSMPCHTARRAKKEVEVVRDKEWADRKQNNRGINACNSSRMNPHCPSSLHLGMKTHKPAMTVTANREKSLWAYSQPLSHYQLQIINVLHAVWSPMPYSIMLCHHHSNWGPHETAGGALGFLGALSPLLWNAVAALLLVAVIALTFDGLLLG